MMSSSSVRTQPNYQATATTISIDSVAQSQQRATEKLSAYWRR